jgi:hypothetical protein
MNQLNQSGKPFSFASRFPKTKEWRFGGGGCYEYYDTFDCFLASQAPSTWQNNSFETMSATIQWDKRIEDAKDDTGVG